MSDWDSFESDAEQEIIKAGKPCGVFVLLTKVPSEHRERVRKAIEDNRLPATAVQRSLRKRMSTDDETPTYQVINRHRRRDCSCYKRV